MFLVQAHTTVLEAPGPTTRRAVLNFCGNRLLNSALKIIFSTAEAQAYYRPEPQARDPASTQTQVCQVLMQSYKQDGNADMLQSQSLKAFSSGLPRKLSDLGRRQGILI